MGLFLFIQGVNQQNRFFKSVTVTLLLLTASTAYGQEVARLASHPDVSCALAGGDVYESPARIAKESQKFSGQCIDTKRFRYVDVIADTPEFLQFSNYNHEDQYWTAQISKTALIEKVFFHVAKFKAISGVTAAHTQLRFKFAANDIQLTNQKTNEVQTVNDLILSFEAARPENTAYNFALGAIDNYVAVGRVVSGAQRLSEYGDSVSIEQFEIAIPHEERMLLLDLGLKKSAKEKYNRFYNTISENCTTDIFAVIDDLPSEKGLNEPFLTVLSNDPIAKPSLAALKERGLLLDRYADLKDEYEVGASKPPTILTEIPKPGILPEVKDAKYSIVFSIPDKQTLNPKQEQAIAEVKDLTYRLLPRALHLLGSSLMLGEGDAKSFLMQFLNKASEGLKNELNALNQNLPDEALNITVYFVPWSKPVGQKLNLHKTLNVKAKLPFDFYAVEEKDLGHITSAINLASQTPEMPDFGFQLYTLALQFHLQKNDWSVALQVLGGLKNRKQEMNSANTQVEILEFEIPYIRKISERSVALMSLQQKINQSQPHFSIEFGAFGGIKPKAFNQEFGQLNIFKSEHNCLLQAQSSPVLHGRFAESATGYSVIDYLFKGKKVKFNIFKVDVDLQTQQVSSMDIRFFFNVLGFPVQCLSQDKVNQSFKQNVNAELKKLTESLQNQDHTELIEPILEKVLSNNPENEVSGLD